MLSVRTCPSLSLTFSPSKPNKKPSIFTFKPYHQCPPSRSLSSTIKMSSSTTTTPQGVEHIVLFKIKKDAEQSKLNAMFNELKSLASLEMVRHLTMGPLLTNNETTTTIPISDLRFTHLFHSRYDTKKDLEVYTAHPSHLGAVRGFVFPICDDLMEINWVAGDSAFPPHPPPGSAIQVSFLKLKDDNDGKVKDEVLRVVGGVKENNSTVGEIIRSVSYGENFSPERAKGFSIASLVVFPGLKEMERVDPSEGLVKVKEHLESVVVVDYAVPFE